MNDNYPIEISPDLIDEFDRNGFVVTPNCFSKEELQQHSDSVDAEVARRTKTDTRQVHEKTKYEQSFVQCMRLWETSRAVAPLSCHAGLAGVAAQLLQVKGVRLWQDQALYKEAGGRETTPHQDQVFWPIGEEPLISAWIPFEDVRCANGAMAYVPGSHKAGRLRVVDITHSTEAYDVLSDPALNGARPQWVEVSAGSVVWHHGMTVHQAAANTTAHVRRVFTIVYIGNEARRIKSWAAFPLDRDRVAVGELIAGEGMPEVWPAPKQLPNPPKARGVAVGPQVD